MVFIICPFANDLKYIDNAEAPVSANELLSNVSTICGIPGGFLSLYNGCKKLSSSDTVENGSSVFVTLSLPGGKGGFGSMLRAIGAQIEKTTNREACRDLSGRRLRDINEEQRLKKWLAKKAEREQEKERRRKERLERMRQLPKHNFNDPEYSKQRSELPERIDDALSAGLKKAKSGVLKKRSRTNGPEPSSKKSRVWSDMDSSSTDSEEEKKSETPSSAEQSSSNDGVKKTSLNEEASSPDDTEESSQDCMEKASQDDTEESSSKDCMEKASSQDYTKEESSQDKAESMPIAESSNDHNKAQCSLEKNDDSTIVERQSNEKANLMDYNCVADMEALGMDKLKSLLSSLGLKCGGTLVERAQRLWSVRTLDPKDYPPALKSKCKKKTR